MKKFSHPCDDATSLSILHYLLYHRRPAAPAFLAARLDVTMVLVNHSLTKLVEHGMVRVMPFQKNGSGIERCAITDLGEQFLDGRSEPEESRVQMVAE